MPNTKRRLPLFVAILAGAILVPAALAHYDDKEPRQSYRQSWFAMVAMNFGPIAASVEGKIPWNDTMIKGWANDLATLTELDIMRGFGEGSEKGTTRAKPEIWENKDDFQSKMQDLKTAVGQLQAAAQSGDREAIGLEVGTVGKTCKACHDEYQSEEYLY